MGKAKTTEIIQRTGGTITRAEAEKAGVPKSDLYRMRDDGSLFEVSRGVFRLKDAPATSALDLVAVCRRVPDGTICLNSALSYWDLTDEIPGRVHIAVAKGKWRPTIDYPPTRVHVFKAETFQLGRETVRVDGGDQISIYSPERTIVDALRLKRRIGSDVTYESLRRYLERPRSKRTTLIRIAREFGVEKAMMRSLDVLG